MTAGGSNAYIDELLDFSESAPTETSQIVEFFTHTNILITGGTGFLGKLLVEKLLRLCPDINKIYLMVRPKKGKTASERFKQNFDNVVYDRLKRERPNFMDQVVMLDSDAAKEDYGLSPEDKTLLMNINIIFHAAANVRFDEKIRHVANINVKATKFLLTFAKTLPNLKAFVHVSTAYSNCPRAVIDEVHYKDFDGDNFLTLMDIMDDEKLEKITSILLDKWPNTYVYTKALGENIVLKYADDFPVCIVRPSIVVSTYKEPIIAWINNMYGYTGVVMASALGLLRTLYCDAKNIADIIPADYVVNNIIASAWDVANIKAERKLDQCSNISDEERVPIYNCVSSCQNPISWGETMKKTEIYAVEIPSKNILWCYMLTLNKYLFMHNIYVFFCHTVPAIVVDILALLTGHKPMLLDAYKKIHKFSNVIHYFSIRQWRFKNNNVMKLAKKLNSVDQQNFYIDVSTLDWGDYFFRYVRGVRTYMLNDSPETIEEARKIYFRKRTAHYTIILIVSLLLLWMLVSFVSYLWSYCPLSHS